MKRFLLLTLSLIVTLLLAAGLLAFTHSGNSWLWRQVCHQLPQLEGEMVSGTLWRGWTFKDLRWRDEQLDFKADRVVLQWQLNQVLERHLTITRLEIDQPVITLPDTQKADQVTETDSSEEEPSETDLSIPIELALEELLINELQLASPDVAIHLNQFRTDLHLKTNQLLVNKAQVNHLKITLPESAENSGAPREEIRLPDITLPLSVKVRELELTDSQFEQGDFQESISRIHLAIEAEEDLIELTDLKLTSLWADVAASGTIQLSKNYPLSFNSRMDMHKSPWPEFFVQKSAELSLSGSLKALHIELENRGTMNGTVQGDIQPLLPQLPFDVSVTWAPLQWPAESKLKELPVQSGKLLAKGSLQHFQVKLDTSLQLQLQNQLSTQILMETEGSLEQLAINKLMVKAGQNQLTASGKLDKNWFINAELKAPALDVLYPGLEGSVNSQFAFQGDYQSIEGNYQLSSPALSFNQTSLTNLQSSGHLGQGKTISGNIDLTLEAVDAGPLQLQQMSFNLTGDELSHTASLSVKGEPVAGSVKVDGSWENNLWTGSIDQADIHSPAGNWRLVETLGITINSQQQASLSAHCWQSEQSSLCIKPSQFASDYLQSEFELTDFSPEQLSEYLPPAMQWQASLTAEGKADWKKGQPPALDLRINSSPGSLTLDDISNEYETLQLNVNLTPERLNGTLDFLSQKLGTANLNIVVDDPQKKRLLTGQFAIERFLLDSFAPVIPEVSALDGVLSAHGRLAGNLDKPLLYGDLILENGSLETDADIARISDLSTRLKLNGTSGDLSGQLSVGEGKLNIGGSLSWSPMPPSGTLTLKGEDLDIHYPGIATAKISPDLTLAFGKATELKGRLLIPSSRIKIKSLPENAVDVSDDVRVIIKGVPIEPTLVEPEKRKAPFNIHVDLIIGEDNKLDAFGLRTDLKGQLRLKQEPARPLEAQGEILLEEGRYRSLGQDLLIKEGKIIFTGSVDHPFLVINAIRNPEAIEDRVTVGIRVSGPLQRPDWEVYSNPDMPQQEQLSYLLRGRSLKGGEEGGLETALLGLGISQLGGVAASIGATLGVSDLTLETEGKGDDTRVTVGGYIAPGLRIQYGAGVFRSVSDIKVRYELMPRLYLQAVSGLAQAVDIFYRFSL